MINHLRALFFASIITVLSCSSHGQHEMDHQVQTKPARAVPFQLGDTVRTLGGNIGCIVQDKKHHYWFASNGGGVYKYDGTTLLHFTTRNGLLSDYVLKIELDDNGVLWFTTRDGVCTFDGTSFNDKTSAIHNAMNYVYRLSSSRLFFNRPNGMCYYDGVRLNGFTLHTSDKRIKQEDDNRAYTVYSSLIDRDGHIWFGTEEKGVCRYDGTAFTFYNGHGLEKAAVRTIYQDRSGTIWAGNNGAGLFRFNGKEFVNFTEAMNLDNPDFLKSLTSKKGTLARPWSINEDRLGNLWVGTIDAGVWKYDGKKLTNYTKENGVSGDAIWYIFRDHRDELWFVVDGNSICTFDGQGFTTRAFH